MAKVFLDTNIFIDIIKRNKDKYQMLVGNEIYVSPLSFHIAFYSLKVKTPNISILKSLDNFSLVNLDEKILKQALNSPTTDLEDNIQLHSAVKANCDIFLTNDKKLLKMVYFGKIKIVSEI